ncbi:MAG: hypothetical protein AABZ10_06055, partial [Nitrospirota bacterium]
ANPRACAERHTVIRGAIVPIPRRVRPVIVHVPEADKVWIGCCKGRRNRGEQGEEDKCECFESVPGHHGAPPIKEFKVHETGFKQEKAYHRAIVRPLLDAALNGSHKNMLCVSSAFYKAGNENLPGATVWKGSIAKTSICCQENNQSPDIFESTGMNASRNLKLGMFQI